MPSPVETYIAELNRRYATGQATEHSYRSAFEDFVKSLGVEAQPLNEPKHSEFGAPDFSFTKGKLDYGHIETKDLGANLDKVESSDQMKRYLGYKNLILTDYLEFRFYKNGVRYQEPIRIGLLSGGTIVPQLEQFHVLSNALKDFLSSPPEQIKSGKRLAEIMGGKARLIRNNVNAYLKYPTARDADILQIYDVIKQVLVHDLSHEHFADMYAQTLAYGLFVARYQIDEDYPAEFTRSVARDLIPPSNPFLRHFFDHIVGPNFDKRLEKIVDELCEIFKSANVKELMSQYFKVDLWNKEHSGPDPVIHFYEDFLKEYDAELRKKMGAYYTPLPVVHFIVRAVDHVLKTDFGLADGLADTAKLLDGRHKVQILDPAVGTGTFLNETIKKIYSRFETQKGRWPAYVHHDLLPRLHGFELMMTPYTIAHLKLSMTLKDEGFKYFNETRMGKARLGIYLTNSLEGPSVQPGLLAFDFGASIAEEAKQAAVIKNETPIMVVLGNPPYSGVSSNETDYANSLVERYKVEPGGTQKLQERKHWLNDDYVKFIAFAESMIEKNGEGIMAMITNHGYIDNPTFRGMRWHLAKTFDNIYILDLHGNAKKKEVAPDGSKDENVFNIQQGVAIIIGIKTGKKDDKLATVYHADLFGKRSFKFAELANEPDWKEVDLDEKMLYFVGKSMVGREEYDEGFGVTELFTQNTTGIVTMGDSFIVNENKEILEERIEDFLNSSISEGELKAKYNLGKNYAKWVCGNRNKIKFDHNLIVPLSYRPFDVRYTYFDNKLVWRYRDKVMSNYLRHDNMGLLFSRMTKGKDFAHVFVTPNISETIFLSPITATNAFNAPLYLYDDDGSRVPNLKKEIVDEIEKTVGRTTPEDIFDYIYAVLHSPSYREKYKEFLKIDFPRVPYPKDKKQFMALVALGKELRELHLLESPKVKIPITTFDVSTESGENPVEKIIYKDGNVYINATQFFGGVPEVAWNFYIGGYQPAQKWLKDRKGRTLTNEDIEHYQKIIVDLVETDRIMKEIDKISST